MNVYQYKIWRLIIWAALVVVAVFVIGSCSNNADSAWNDVKLKYEVGAICTTSDGDVKIGDFVDDNSALYTYDLIKCTGFRIVRDSSYIVSYEVHYYDKDDKHLVDENGLPVVHYKESLEYTVPSGSMPEGAVGIRIVVRSIDDVDMNFVWNMWKYDDALTLSTTNIPYEGN